jgi:hypothetical protein
MSKVFNEAKYNQVELPVFVKSYDFLKGLFPITEKFPKRVRVTLVNRVDSIVLELIEDLIEAKYSRNKLQLLREANLKLEKLRILLRFSHDFDLKETPKPKSAGHKSFDSPQTKFVF